MQLLLQSLASLMQGSQVGEHELGIDDLDIANWINRRADMMKIRIFKTAYHLHDRFHFTNMMKELIPESFACARAFDESGDVHKLDRRRCDLLRAGNLGDVLEARIGHGDNAHIGIDRAEGIILRRRLMCACDRIKKRRFPNVRQTYNSSA